MKEVDQTNWLDALGAAVQHFGVTEWLNKFWMEFSTMKPSDQIALSILVISFIGGGIAAPWIWQWSVQFREKKTTDLALENTDGETFSVLPLQDTNFEGAFRWLYQWETGDNVLPQAVDPPLEDAIALEICQAALEGKKNFLVFVRGELGIGKSTLLKLLPEALKRASSDLAEDETKIRNFVQTARMLEAGDLTKPDDFAAEVIELLNVEGATVVLARPATLDIASRRIITPPDKVVNMLPFEPTGPLFHECLTVVAGRMGLTDERQRIRLGEIAGQFNNFLKTPFYFEQAARALKSVTGQKERFLSPLEIFQHAIEDRAHAAGISFDRLLMHATGEQTPSAQDTLPGITGNGHFLHDGYRNVIIASAVVSGKISFHDATHCKNAVPAIRIVLSHLEAIKKHGDQKNLSRISNEIRRFIESAAELDQNYFPIYISGLAAASFRNMKEEAPAEILRSICFNLIQERAVQPINETFEDTSVWWDISDALSEIGGPRLREAKSRKYSRDSGYLSYFPKQNAVIGSNVDPKRTDLAKPVLAYNRTTISVGPLWVANFLVTNEQFLEFWDVVDRQKYFVGTGRQWLNQDIDILGRIEEMFDIAARRNFWKELRDIDSVAVGSRRISSQSPIELARKKAMHPHSSDQIQLWDPINADQRFSARGQPVVGVNWWEANAYCRWWEQTKLKDTDLPPGSTVSLLADWEWEAIRRKYYENEDSGEETLFDLSRFPAHTRVPSEALQTGRIGNIMRPLHVGLSLPPILDGPTDMVGNVWEWTRSRVLGKICSSDEVSETFGNTRWSHGDQDSERNPLTFGRDMIDEENDLYYRAVRGGSFFSRDPQAAWHPAYRLCDPPFSSYIDLGFRIAIYPPKNN